MMGYACIHMSKQNMLVSYENFIMNPKINMNNIDINSTQYEFLKVAIPPFLRQYLLSIIRFLDVQSGKSK